MRSRILKLHGAYLVAFYLILTLRNTEAAKESAASSEERIITEVIGKFSTDVRPVVDSKNTVNVTLDITFNNIIDLDEKFQILKSSIWVRQSWHNPFFQWNQSHYGGLKSILIDSRKIWLPDFVLYNNIKEESNAQLDQRITRVRIYNNGLTFWASPFIFKTLCKINVENFPFDTQECKLTFGAWQYDGTEVNIQNNKKLASIAKTRVASGEWDVLKVEIKRTVVYYQCCPDLPYPELAFVIHMKRKPMFFVVNLIIPNILIALLAFFSFFIPVECGERISFVITVLLSMTVFMLLMAENIPPTSDAVPLIGIYYTFSIVEVFLALAATSISIRINYSYLFGGGLSPRLRHVIFNWIGPWLGFDVPKLLGTKPRRKPLNPSSVSYRCNCYTGNQRTSSMSPTDEIEENLYTDAASSAGRARKHDHMGNHQHNYLEMSNKPTTNGQAESLIVDGRNDLEARLYYRQRKDRVTKDNALDVLPVGRSEEEQNVIESKLAAFIIDRFFLWIFTATYVISSAVILCTPLFR